MIFEDYLQIIEAFKLMLSDFLRIKLKALRQSIMEASMACPLNLRRSACQNEFFKKEKSASIACPPILLGAYVNFSQRREGSLVCPPIPIGTHSISVYRTCAWPLWMFNC